MIYKNKQNKHNLNISRQSVFYQMTTEINPSCCLQVFQSLLAIGAAGKQKHIQSSKYSLSSGHLQEQL